MMFQKQHQLSNIRSLICLHHSVIFLGSVPSDKMIIKKSTHHALCNYNELCYAATVLIQVLFSFYL